MILRLEKRKSGIYYIIVDRRQEGGKREYISTQTKSKAEANKVLGEYQHKLNTHTLLPSSKTLFTDFLQEWLNEYVTLSCRKSTYESYQLCINTHIIPWFKQHNLMLEEVTPIVLQKYYYSKLKSGLSPNTIRKHHANIRKCLDYAKKMQLISNNPADNVELPKKIKFKGKYYNAEQVTQLLSSVKDTPIETPVALAVGLGLRRGEVLGLKWEHVNFENGVIFICSTRTRYVKEEILDKTKNEESTRVLNMPGYISDYLSRLKNNSTILGEYVCSWEDGTPLKVDYVSRKFKEILTKNNMPHIRFHDLRHTNASLLLSKGVDLKRIQGWLGHAQLSTTSDIYAHLDEKYKLDNANIINGILAKPN
ncbi:MAG: Tyrosine recombinase XerC [Firmicutes bacterium ADurb.Bin419]|nr:MAG: Tyrosine recombinase XerC [Firmicutes bacterium ADurb.Bin419]